MRSEERTRNRNKISHTGDFSTWETESLRTATGEHMDFIAIGDTTVDEFIKLKEGTGALRY